jgi:DNA-binding NarL/FixJ family response regulator
MQNGGNIHVMHARPLMTAGLAAALRDREWRVTTHDREPGAAAGADLVIADYDTGLGFARAGRQLLIVTHRDKEADVLRACAAAVAGYLLEDVDPADLRHAVRRILTGDRHYSPGVAKHLEAGGCREHLTNRETDVLRLLAGGRCDKQIARDLGIGVGTVRWHLRNLMGKLGVSARLQAVVVAAQRGIVGIDGVVPG